MDETTFWLQASLPTENYAVDLAFGSGTQYYARSIVSGCLWNIQVASWSTFFPGNKEAASSAKTVAVIRFEPRAGLSFPQRKMTTEEQAAFSNVVGETKKPTFAYVDSVNFADVRLHSFRVWRAPETPADYWLGTTGKYAFVTSIDADQVQRYVAALQHLAELCGAKDDPF